MDNCCRCVCETLCLQRVWEVAFGWGKENGALCWIRVSSQFLLNLWLIYSIWNLTLYLQLPRMVVGMQVGCIFTPFQSLCWFILKLKLNCVLTVNDSLHLHIQKSNGATSAEPSIVSLKMNWEIFLDQNCLFCDCLTSCFAAGDLPWTSFDLLICHSEASCTVCIWSLSCVSWGWAGQQGLICLLLN